MCESFLIQSFVYPFSKSFLKTCHISDTGLCAGHIAGNETHMVLALVEDPGETNQSFQHSEMRTTARGYREPTPTPNYSPNAIDFAF